MTTKQLLNLFPFENLTSIKCVYTLFEVRNLPADDYLDSNLHKLKKLLATQIRQPVALVRRGASHFLALPANVQPKAEEYEIGSHLAVVKPIPGSQSLDYSHLDDETQGIGQAFLQSALFAALSSNPNLWHDGTRFYLKRPVNQRDDSREIDLMGGFAYNVVPLNGTLYLSLDPLYKYIDRQFLTGRYAASQLQGLSGQNCLYQLGQSWYLVQLLGPTGTSIREHRFRHDQLNQSFDVYTFTTERYAHADAPWVTNLDPDSPTILYTYPGLSSQSEPVRRAGAAALCRLTYPTNHAQVRNLHPSTIKYPDARFTQAQKFIEYNFKRVSLCGSSLRIGQTPYATEAHAFPVPDLLFGHNRVLHVKRAGEEVGVDLADLGETRMRWLLARDIGPMTTTAFDAQYLFLPESIAREVGEDFQKHFTAEMEGIMGQPYIIRPIWYEDQSAYSLMEQWQAIDNATKRVQLDRGYLLMMLPVQAHPALHDLVKKRFYEAGRIQMQCVAAQQVQSFYESLKPARLRPDKEPRYRSYLQLTALGMMQVNRKWPFGLHQALHHEVYVGIDVLNGVAGFTFIYDNAKHCYFHAHPADQKEKLLPAQIRQVLYNQLAQDMKRLGLRPALLVIHRDGRCFPDERRAIRQVFQKLVAEEALAADAVLGIVEIPKGNSYHLRLVQQEGDGRIRNPLIGSYEVLSRSEGIICNTGEPFYLRGTVRPLAVRLVEGPLDIEKILQDVFALSLLAWSAPKASQRLPATIKVADDFLEPIATSVDEDIALYGEEDDEDNDEWES